MAQCVIVVFDYRSGDGAAASGVSKLAGSDKFGIIEDVVTHANLSLYEALAIEVRSCHRAKCSFSPIGLLVKDAVLDEIRLFEILELKLSNGSLKFVHHRAHDAVARSRSV